MFKLDVPSATDVSDMTIGRLPRSDGYYLAIAINSKINWPKDADRNKPEYLTINE